MIDVAKEIHASENATITFEKIASEIEGIHYSIRQKWNKNTSLPILDRLTKLAENLKRRE